MRLLINCIQLEKILSLTNPAKIHPTLGARHQNSPNFLWVKVWVKVVNSIDKLLNFNGYLYLLCFPQLHQFK